MKPNRYNVHSSATKPASLAGAPLLISVGLLALGAAVASAGDTYWTNPLVGDWTVGTNWDTGLPPASGDYVYFGPGSAPGVAITPAGIINVNTSPTVGVFRISNAAALTFSSTTPQTLTLNEGIATDLPTGSGTHSIAGVVAATGLSVVLGADNIWALDGVAGGLTVSANITDGANTFSITKTGTRGLNLNGNNTFDGGIVWRQGNLQMGGAAANTVLGNGTFTWGNLAGGFNNALALNANVSKTFANNFINDNAAAVSGTQYAQLSIFGGVFGYKTMTLNGSFSTGPNYNAGQSLVVGANGTATGLAEGTIFFNGDWSGYNLGLVGGVPTANGQALRIDAGAIVINSANSMMAGGGYSVTSNSAAVAAKLILAGPYTMNNSVNLASASFGQRNSFGSRNAAATTATLAGSLSVNDVDGGNLFSQTTGATLAVTGSISGTNSLYINNPYTLTTADNTNSLQTPTGTVALNRPTGSTTSTFVPHTGATTVVGGTLLAGNNTSGSATGQGQVNVGLISPAATGQSGTTAAGSRVITLVNFATASALQIGQAVTGTNIPANSVVTGITLGNQASIVAPLPPNNCTVVIDKTTTVAGAVTDLAFGALTRTATLGGTGRIAPLGANGLLVRPGSSLGLVDGVAEDLEVSFREIPAVVGPPAVPAVPASGNATFASGATFAMDLGAPGTSDSVKFTGLVAPSTATVAFNNNVINFTNLGGLAVGTYTLFTFDDASKYTGTLAIGTGITPAFSGVLVYHTNDIQLVVSPGTDNYATWLAGKFTAPELLDPAISGPKSDPDGDGNGNLLEYVIGTEPKTPEQGKGPVYSTPGNLPTITLVAKTSSLASATVTGRSGTTLASWPDSLPLLSSTADSPAVGQTTLVFKSLTTFSSPPARFFHLELTAP